MAMVLFGVASESTVTFSSIPKSLYAGGASMGAPLFAAIDGHYVFYTDTVTTTFETLPNASMALAAYDEELIDLAVLPSRLTDVTRAAGPWAQLPVAAYGLVATLPEPATLVLARDVLARMWTGNISTWDDPAIAALNGGTSPLAGNITLAVTVYDSAADEFASTTGLFARALSLFDPTGFGAAYKASGGILATTVRGLGRFGGGGAVDILDGPGDGTWPLAGLLFGVMGAETARADCSFTDAVLHMLTWLQLNDGAMSLLTADGLAPLTDGFRRRTIDAIANVTCDGAPAITASVFVGAGSPLPLWSEWAGAYDPQGVSFILKYFQATTLIAQPLVASYQVDFAGVVRPTVPPADLALHPDLRVVPIGMHSFVVGYNVPEVPRGAPPLVLSLPVLAAIYLDQISTWDDPAIVALNPQLAPHLPPEPIVVVINKGGPADQAGGPGGGISNQVLAETLSVVPGFAAEVYNGTNITYPIQYTNRSIMGGHNGVVDYVANTTHSLGSHVYSSMAAARVIRFLHLINVDGGTTAPTGACLTAAAQGYGSIPSHGRVVNAPGNASWPMLTWDFIELHGDTLPDCRKTGVLLDWLYWTQTSAQAASLAISEGSVVASQVAWAAPRVLAALDAVECSTTGLSAFSLSACVTSINGSSSEAAMCSGHGTCRQADNATGTAEAACACDPGWTGTRCGTPTSAAGSSAVLAAALGGTLGGLALLALLALCTVAIVAVSYRAALARLRRDRNEWEIDLDDVEMGPLIGVGGFGEVRRATWRGTEVAVKTLPAKRVSPANVRDFREEVRVMTALRHPNVVLFMAACTRPPRLAIVMELMTLGSLYDLLGNELITHLPLALRVKIAHQAAKGMWFLHSSGIVHRDLKSLNVLLDARWNAKIADFGLTRFAGGDADAGRNAADDRAVFGTVQWTAPEVLSGEDAEGSMLSDVYSFAIILWELLTREQPYAGMSPAAVAVGVLRDGLRPPLSTEDDPALYLAGETLALAEPLSAYIDLTISCWKDDPQMRPLFQEVANCLSTIMDDLRGAGNTHTATPSTTSSSTTGMETGDGRAFHRASASAVSSSSGNGHGAWMHGGAKPPEGRVAAVYSDIADANALWSARPDEMRDATLLHNELLRALAARHRGYEAVLPRGSGEGTFFMVFARPADAVAWCADVQRELLAVEWPPALLDCTGADEVLGHDEHDRALFRGPRVRMGLHVGLARTATDPKTRRARYHGDAVARAAPLVAQARPGQVLLSREAAVALSDDAYEAAGAVARWLGSAKDSGGDDDDDNGSDGVAAARVAELVVRGLEGREFPLHCGEIDLHAAQGKGGRRYSTGDPSPLSSSSCERRADADTGYITTANLCRWVIDFGDIEIGRKEPLGAGSYGVVYRGRWRGVDVAVKRFVKQRLTERRLLEFRAEVAFLSELQHPNVVLFVGACVHPPNLCVVTEYVARGSLAGVLASPEGHRLPFERRMRMLRAAATGVAYLHGLRPPVVHRDLKSSNLLVDESHNVKVADFGLARIKEENATMTRCGTPCWTAPEIIRGERYDERADVYSFGVIAWEVLTRRRPYEGDDFMKVTLGVLEGRRPAIPEDCPEDLRRLVEACWHADMGKRPTMDQVVNDLGIIIGDHIEPPV